MQSCKLDAYIPENRRLEVVLPNSFPSGAVELTVLVKPSDAVEGMSLREFSAWLNQQPPTGRSQEEIDEQIASERNSWGDD